MRLEAIIFGDVLASFAFGLVVSLVPIAVGLALGVTVSGGASFALAIGLAGLCFASLGNVFSIPADGSPGHGQYDRRGDQIPRALHQRDLHPLG